MDVNYFLQLVDHREARVVCRMLGFDDEAVRHARAMRGAAYGMGVGEIHLDNMRCDGDEKSLVDCQHFV